MTWPLSRGATLLFVLVIILLVLNGFVFDRNLQAIREDSAWVAHTHEVIAELDAALSTLKDAEASVRGYVIAGKESYLEPYRRAAEELPERFQTIRLLIQDNPSQVTILDSLDKKAADRIAHLGLAEQARANEGFAAAQAIVTTEDGRQLMDEVRTIVGEMTQNERQLLVERDNRTAASYRRAIGAAVLATAVGIGSVIALLMRIAREMRIRMRAQSEANQQRENLQVTLASIGDAVIVVDVLGQVTFMNQAAQLVTRWALDEALGQPLTKVFDIINESTRSVVESPAAKALREGTVVGLANHTVLIAKDGHEVSIDDSAAPIRDEAGVVSGVVLVFRDISVKRRLEVLEKEQHEAMVIAQRRKDEFLAMLAHELRNPIAPIANALQLMAIRPPAPAEFAELREIMARQIEQMRRLIDDLLDISRISRGKFDLHPETIELAAVLRSAIDTSQPLIDAAGHTLSLQIPATAIFLQGDRVRLAQVVANLLNNAAKYTERGGRIALSAEVVEQNAFIRVKDTGVGISPEQLEHVFEVFTQVDASLTRSQGGLGIGLTLAKNIVEMHGGSIEACSDGPGKGSEFVVRLPMKSSLPVAGPLAPSKAGESLNHLPKRKILVVDDMQASATVLSRLLRALGQDVSTAHDGMAALEAVRREVFDLIFSDIAMPGMSGYELAPRLTAHPNSKHAMLIALTGYGQQEDAERATQAGFQEHLVKPVGLDDLRMILERSSSATSEG